MKTLVRRGKEEGDKMRLKGLVGVGVLSVLQ